MGKGAAISREAVRAVITTMDEAKRKMLSSTPEYMRADAALKTDAAKTATGSVGDLFA